MGAEKAAVRREGRQRRRALATDERIRMDAAICGHIERLGAYRRARRVAIYLDFDGEPSITRLPMRAGGCTKRFYSPALIGSHMHFHAFGRGTRYSRNTLGIREPIGGSRIDPRSLDLVLTPLVAFDRNGVRLGMGGGYYDRTFAFLRARGRWSRPKLVGVAYGFQETSTPLPHEPWDVLLWGIVSEQGFRICREG